MNYSNTYGDDVFDGKRLKNLLECSDRVGFRAVQVRVADIEGRRYLVELAVRQD